MLRRCFASLFQAVLLLGLAALSAQPLHAAEAERFNIIAIVTDDQARWALGCYGNKDARTPNMDRIAREGARFLNAFVPTPVCSPSRASFFTGRYGTQVGITDWIAPVESDAGLGLPADAVTWPRVLQKNGYTTALIGKWHLGTKPRFHPTKHGFDHFFGFLGGGNRPMDPTLEVEGKEKQLKGSLPDLLVDDALQFIQANRTRPFAVSLHFRAPHLPYGPVPLEDSTPFRDLDPTIPKAPGMDVTQVKKWTRDYYASIHSVDRNLGRLLAKLDELKLASKTIILFTSDHGYMIGHHGLHTKGNGYWIAGGVQGPKRPNMFEESIRVPLLIRWPGVVKPGTEISEPVSNIDTFASVLGMLHVPVPEAVKQEGADFSPLLRGKKIPWRDTIYGQYDLHNSGLAYLRMIRTAEWKLVRHHHSNFQDELYHLAKDPGEAKNLHGDANVRKVRDDLQERLTAWQRSIGDPILRTSTRERTAAPVSHEAPDQRPLNVVFILADDLGYGDLGCYGHPKIRTPHLDRLAKEGMRFTQFYVTSPVCSPSRASFLTGRHPQRFGIHHADLPEQLPRYSLPVTAVTVNKLLRKAGYRTAHFGKWHLGEPPDTGLPRKHGFDHFFGTLGGRPSSSWTKFARYDDAQFILNENQPKTYPGYGTDVLTDRVLQYLDGAAKGDKPFYINLWYNSPHEPLSPKVKQAELYADRDKKEQVYFGSVTNLDDNVGRVLKKLDDLGVASNTLVVFSSDNGPEVHTFQWAAGSAGPLRGMKTQLWEGGIRVPLIVRLPGMVPAGKMSDAVASSLDFLPSICEFAGVDAPPSKDRDEGISLVPILTGKGKAEKRCLYWEFHGSQRGGPPSGSVVVREGDWKLHVYFQKEKRELHLYNLATDPGEQEDVLEQHKDLAARLEKKALEWYEQLPKEKATRQRVPVPETEAEANRLPS